MKIRTGGKYSNNTSDLVFNVIRVTYENDEYVKCKGYFTIKGKDYDIQLDKKNHKIYKKNIEEAEWYYEVF